MVVKPTMMYAAPTLRYCPATNVKQLQVLQNRCLKMCLRLGPRHSTVDVHRQAKIDTVLRLIAKQRQRFEQGCSASTNDLISTLVS